MTKEVEEVLMNLVHEVAAMSSPVYYDRHNKVDSVGQLDAPSPLVKDSQFHRPTCERELRPTMNLVERGRFAAY
jgi:hypothetical protein